MVVIVRVDIHGGCDFVVSISDVRLVTPSPREGSREILDLDYLPTIATSRTLVPGREYSTVSNIPWLSCLSVHCTPSFPRVLVLQVGELVIDYLVEFSEMSVKPST